MSTKLVCITRQSFSFLNQRSWTLNPAEIDKVIEYIQLQEEHHKKKTFKDEFRVFLKKYKVEYDNRYVWD